MMLQYPLHHVTYARTTFEDGAVQEMHLQENTVLDFAFWVKVTGDENSVPFTSY